MWFTNGARALRAEFRVRGIEGQLPSDEDWYACPLCLNVVFKIEVLDEPDPALTVEHAPPKWSGGTELALTCKRCNNEAGRLFDAEAQKLQRMRGFVAGQTGEPVRAAFTVDGVTIYGDWHMTGTGDAAGMYMAGVPKANNQADLDRMVEALDRHVGTGATGLSFQITPRTPLFPDRARVSWIRAAYIVAFARFGWRYILQPALQPMREHFLDPTGMELPILSMTDPDADPARREFWIIREPFDRRSVFVVMGQQTVILPLPRDPRSLEELSRSWVGDHDLAQRATGTLTGTQFPWPEGPCHSLDPTPTS